MARRQVCSPAEQRRELWSRETTVEYLAVYRRFGELERQQRFPWTGRRGGRQGCGRDASDPIDKALPGCFFGIVHGDAAANGD